MIDLDDAGAAAMGRRQLNGRFKRAAEQAARKQPSTKELALEVGHDPLTEMEVRLPAASNPAVIRGVTPSRAK